MRVSPNPIRLISLSKGKIWTEIETHGEEITTQPCDWNDASTRQRTARFASKQQKLGEARKDSPLEASEGAWFSRQLDLRQKICVVLSHQVCITF